MSRWLSILAITAFATTARAQDEDPLLEEPAEAEGTEPAKPAESSASEEELVGRKGAPFPRIADEEETIYAVQLKAYLIKGKVELTPMGGVNFTDRFVFTGAVGGSISYHLAENFALELSGGYMFPTESELTTEILDEDKLTPEIAKLTQLLWVASLGVTWSPVYGKMQVFGTSLGNFQFYLGAGGGVGQTRVQCTSGMMLDPERGFNPPICPMIEGDGPSDEIKFVYEPATFRFIGHLSGGFRFYFADWIGIKLEVKDYLFVSRVYRPDTQEATQKFTDAVRNNIFVQLGVSFLLGGSD